MAIRVFENDEISMDINENFKKPHTLDSKNGCIPFRERELGGEPSEDYQHYQLKAGGKPGSVVFLEANRKKVFQA